MLLCTIYFTFDSKFNYINDLKKLLNYTASNKELLVIYFSSLKPY